MNSLIVAELHSRQPELCHDFGLQRGFHHATLQDELLKIWSGTQQTVFMITHDIDEAILLADRILLMTNGPLARVAESVEITIPRPRDRTRPGGPDRGGTRRNGPERRGPERSGPRRDGTRWDGDGGTDPVGRRRWERTRWERDRPNGPERRRSSGPAALSAPSPPPISSQRAERRRRRKSYPGATLGEDLGGKGGGDLRGGYWGGGWGRP